MLTVYVIIKKTQEEGIRVKHKKDSVQSMIFISLFATLMCIGAWIHFPSAVPATMQTFVVFIALGILGSKRTFAVLTVYILLGITGLPVFSGFTGGIGALTGPTAGFIWGFVLGVPVFGVFEKHFSSKKHTLYIAYILYILLHYIPGALWYCYFTLKDITFGGFMSSVLVTVVPFIIPDAVKLITAILTVKRINSLIKTKL